MGIVNGGNASAMLWRAAVVVAGLMLGGASLAPSAWADTTVNVNTTNGASAMGDGLCSLPEAVAYADGATEPDCAPGTATGTTTFNLPASTSKYTIPSTLSITQDTTINGGGAAGTTIDGGGNVQVINIGAAAHVRISGATISGGLTSDATTGCTGYGLTLSCPQEDGLPGGGIANAGTLSLDSSVVTGNRTAPGVGPFSFTILACFTFPNCPARTGEGAGNGGNGGGIYNTGQLTVANSTISNNTAGDGGSGTNGVSGTGTDASPGQNGGSGGSGGDGGGVYNTGGLTITNSTIGGNAAGKGGNAGAGSDATQAGANGGNTGFPSPGGGGGGIYSTGPVAVTGSTISGNRTGVGGAGANGGAGASGGVGGFSTFSANGGSGGGIESASAQMLSASNDTVANNVASPGGTGGVGPGAGGIGGGIINEGTALIALTYVTVAGNQAAGPAGGLFVGIVGPITETNSIVASNTGSTADNCAGSGGHTVTDSGHNLVFGDNSCPGTSGQDPKLGLLENNGGPTPTMAVRAGSAAIDLVPANACILTADQRGVGRPQGGGCDAGAYEFAPPSLGGVSGVGNTTTTATVSASVNPNLKDTVVVVDYGPTTAYGSSTAAQDVGSGNGPTAFAGSIGGLTPGATYHFQVVATNGDGTTASGDGAFTTIPPVSATIPPLSATIVSATSSGRTLSLTIACGGGGGGGACGGPIMLTSYVTTVGGKTVAVTAKAKKPKPKRVTKIVTVARGSYLVATGRRVTVNITLNATGQKLLQQRYTLPATITVSGTTGLTKKVTFSYPVIRSPISFRWLLTASSAVAQQLTITNIPSGGRVTVICHGGGCPFGKRTFVPHRGLVVLAPALGHSSLRPGATLRIQITAQNRVGKVVLFTIRRGRPPAMAKLCLPPGALAPSRCAA